MLRFSTLKAKTVIQIDIMEHKPSRSNSLEAFLANNHISQEDWEKSNSDWIQLDKIATNHAENGALLLQTAELFAKLIQTFDRVHSVRWRVKDSDHLLEKIVRKRAEGVEKYLNLRLENYHEIVTDLVGIRALHLFKDECFEIDKSLRETWEPIEDPIAYFRKGDNDDFLKKFQDIGVKHKEHSKGYRSIHYVFSSQAVKRTVQVEIQVRTIFEEGWSEIDHRIRYPNFSNNALVAYLLYIFNGMAGSADEVGSFIRALALAQDENERQLSEATREKDLMFASVTAKVTELENATQQNQEFQEKVNGLKLELEKLKRPQSIAASLLNGLSIPQGVLAGALQAQKDMLTILPNIQALSVDYEKLFPMAHAAAIAQRSLGSGELLEAAKGPIEAQSAQPIRVEKTEKMPTSRTAKSLGEPQGKQSKKK